LTPSETLYFKAFHAISSHEENLPSKAIFHALGKGKQVKPPINTPKIIPFER